MAGGPVLPYSAMPTGNKAFAYIYVPSGGNVPEELFGVEASLGSDVDWVLYFEMPKILPSGTAKLRLQARANATSGVAKINPTWGMCAEEEEDPDAITLTAEGTATVTWSSGDADVYKMTEVTLDADTIVAGETLVMRLVFETTDWTLAAISGWKASVIWE